MSAEAEVHDDRSNCLGGVHLGERQRDLLIVVDLARMTRPGDASELCVGRRKHLDLVAGCEAIAGHKAVWIAAADHDAPVRNKRSVRDLDMSAAHSCAVLTHAD